MIRYNHLSVERLRIQAECDTDPTLLKVRIDEIAVVYHTVAQLEEGVRRFELAGTKEFNRTRDEMHCTHSRIEGLEGTSFDVQFVFLQKPGSVWRIEAMCVLGGDAPLHMEILRKSKGEPRVVHASWKHTSERYYNAMKLHMEDATLEPSIASDNPPFSMVAQYRNSYGVFSYWPKFGTYLKPRVNLRDV